MVYTVHKTDMSKNKSDETQNKNKSKYSRAKSAADDGASLGAVGKPPLSVVPARATSAGSRQNDSTLVGGPESNSCMSMTSSMTLPRDDPTSPRDDPTSPPECCNKCRPIYQRQGQVTLPLDPARLLCQVNHGPPASDPTRSQLKKADESSFFPGQARNYGSMCACAESGTVDPQCGYHQASKWQLCLPRNSPWWPAVKRCLLVVAALIPIVFLIVYIVLHQLWKR